MNCKFCNAQMDEEHKFCPYCGRSQEENQEQPEELIPADAEQVLETVKEKKQGKVWKLILAIAGGVVALGVLAVVLLYAFGVKLTPRPNDVYKMDAYTVENEKAVKKANDVVAVVGEKELTNAQLQVYYRMQVQDFLRYYGSYLSTLGLDYTKPLSEQTCYFDQTMTWEQYFLSNALNSWYEYQSLALLAEKNGFTLDEQWHTEFEKLPEEMESQAVENGYESAEAFVQEIFGPACMLEHYMKYIELLSVSGEYYASEYERLTPTTQEVENFFAENQATYEEEGITKDSGLISSVRHILVCPEGTEDEDGKVVSSDADWAACLAEAEKILNEWKAGEATQESFAELAGTYTEDEGSKSTGGLYEGVAPGSNYVEEFLAWAIDMDRKEGDTDIVKTQFGYHIMYFVSGEEYWFNVAQSDLLTERTTTIVEDAKKEWPMEVNYRKIALSEPKIS